jgi:hypothetical protein
MSEADEDKSSSPVPKKLRSSEPDLLIKVGEKEQYDYKYHSAIMAGHSDYIDTMLASPMKESTTREIEMLDVTPRTWGLMMRVLDYPPSELAKFTTITDDGDNILLDIACAYDKYQFTKGISLCDDVFASDFSKAKKMLVKKNLRGTNLDSLLETAVVCDRLHLKKATTKANEFFRMALHLSPDGDHFGALVFTQDQLKKLVPLIAQERLWGDRWTAEEILCPLFPKHYIMTMLTEYERRRFGPLHQRVPSRWANLFLSNKPNSTEDDYKQYKTFATLVKDYCSEAQTPMFVGDDDDDELTNRQYFRLHKEENGNWTVAKVLLDDDDAVVEVVGIFWESPMSHNCINFPPVFPRSSHR